MNKLFKILLLAIITLGLGVDAAPAGAQSFASLSTTTNVAVLATAATLTLPTTTAVSVNGLRPYLVTAAGTQTAFIRCDGTTATVANGMPILANQTIILNLPVAVTTCSTIAGATGTTVYATVGQ
jgi:hypothetical protein